MLDQSKNEFVNLSLCVRSEDKYSEPEKMALPLVLDYLTGRNEGSSEYYIRFVTTAGPSVLVAELRHKTLFTEDGVYNPGPRISVGGTSRDIWCDIKENKIAKVVFMR